MNLWVGCAVGAARLRTCGDGAPPRPNSTTQAEKGTRQIVRDAPRRECVLIVMLQIDFFQVKNMS